MKARIAISAALGLVVAACAFFAGRGCDGGTTVTETVTVHDTLIIQGDSVVLPGRLAFRDKIITSTTGDSALRAARALAATLQARLADALQALSLVQLATASADTVLLRHALLKISGREYDVAYLDSLRMSYDFPPANVFRHEVSDVRICVDDTTQVATQSSGRPWWVDVALAVGGLVVGITTALVK